MPLPLTLLLLTLSQSAPSPETQDAAHSAARAADAAERAALAAEHAAEAAQRVAASLPGAPAGTAAPAPTAAPSGHPWTGSGTLGLISLTGNSSTLTLNSTATAAKQWDAWAVGFKAFGTYGQGRATATLPTQTTALAAGFQARGDRALADHLSTFVQSGIDTNHVKSVEYNLFGEAGASYVFWDVKQGDFQKALLRADLAARFAHESRFQYFPTPAAVPSVDLFGPRAGLLFRYAMNKEVIFSQDAEVIPSLIGNSRVLVNATTKLTSRLTASFSLAAAFQVAYDSAPAAGKVPTDTATTIGIEYAL